MRADAGELPSSSFAAIAAAVAASTLSIGMAPSSARKRRFQAVSRVRWNGMNTSRARREHERFPTHSGPNDVPEDMNAPDIARDLAELRTSLNLVWTLFAGFLVMFMQAGFALVEAGLARAKNVAHTMGMNF